MTIKTLAAKDTTLAPTRPKSAVGSGVGLAGLAALLIWIVVARALNVEHPEYELSGKWYALGAVFACGLPMVLWSLCVDKVHRNPTTGIDWDAAPKPLREMRDISLTKLAGLWTTWLMIGAVYCIGRWYWSGAYSFTTEVLLHKLLGIYVYAWLFILSIPYVLWIDTRLTESKDGAWALGAWLIGEQKADWDAINAHLRSWAVKGFFLAFMISIVPGGYHQIVEESWSFVTERLVNLTNWLISFMFVIDVSLATVGYLLTAKPLDAHIRSATPYAAGWVAALICYPPFVLMTNGGPLDYHQATAEWNVWMDGHPVLMTITAFWLVFLTGCYAWATMAFGIRFSNLTDRGILTSGPYALTKHPAYLSKNLFWWLSTLPFLVTTHSYVDAIRNTALLACVSGVYYWRARTEEWHLRNDPIFVEYEAWMAEHGVITSRLKRVLGF